jgi:hypothetical protein
MHFYNENKIKVVIQQQKAEPLSVYSGFVNLNLSGELASPSLFFFKDFSNN